MNIDKLIYYLLNKLAGSQEERTRYFQNFELRTKFLIDKLQTEQAKRVL